MAQQTNTKISAVIAVYNGAQHIIEAIESILGQTQPVHEIVLVNDGSKDNSLEVVESFLKKNSKAKRLVKIISQENAGQGSARNRGVAEAAGDLIGFLDQDDSWEPTHCEVLSQYFLRDQRLGWVYTDFNEFDEQGRFIRRNFLQKQDYEVPINSIFGLIEQDLMMLPSSALIRREAFLGIGGFDTQFRGYEDDDLFFRLFVAGWKYDYHSEALINYRIHPSNSSRQLTFPQSRMRFYRKYRDFFQKDEPYYGKFFHEHLGARIASALIQDAAVASRDKWTEAYDFARVSLKEVYSNAGYVPKTRLAYFVVSNRWLLNLYVKIRGFWMRLFNKDKLSY